MSNVLAPPVRGLSVVQGNFLRNDWQQPAQFEPINLQGDEYSDTLVRTKDNCVTIDAAVQPGTHDLLGAIQSPPISLRSAFTVTYRFPQADAPALAYAGAAIEIVPVPAHNKHSVVEPFSAQLLFDRVNAEAGYLALNVRGTALQSLASTGAQESPSQPRKYAGASTKEGPESVKIPADTNWGQFTLMYGSDGLGLYVNGGLKAVAAHTAAISRGQFRILVRSTFNRGPSDYEPNNGVEGTQHPVQIASCVYQPIRVRSDHAHGEPGHAGIGPLPSTITWGPHVLPQHLRAAQALGD
jgi:hypothetical protein